VTTLYEHTNPVNTVAVTDDSNYFFTGSRDDRKVCVWKVANIEQDVTSRPLLSLSANMQINQVSSLQNSQAIAVAGSQGVNIYDLTRALQDGSSQEFTSV
jgi:WD40 repeat protein